jgi:acyl carrier protein
MLEALSVLEDTIRDYLCEELGYAPEEIQSDTLLFTSGMVDSFTFVGMIALIETRLGTRLDPREVTVENFDSLERMMAFLRDTLG